MLQRFQATNAVFTNPKYGGQRQLIQRGIEANMPLHDELRRNCFFEAQDSLTLPQGSRSSRRGLLQFSIAVMNAWDSIGPDERQAAGLPVTFTQFPHTHGDYSLFGRRTNSKMALGLLVSEAITFRSNLEMQYAFRNYVEGNRNSWTALKMERSGIVLATVQTAEDGTITYTTKGDATVKMPADAIKTKHDAAWRRFESSLNKLLRRLIMGFHPEFLKDVMRPASGA